MSKIGYLEKGQGPPLVLIHGFCETNRIWDRFAIELSSTYRVLMPDLPGFGLSPLPPGSLSIDDVGLTLLEWLAHLRVDNPVVIGHSLGGYVALAMAAEKPDRLAGLGLFHSTASADSEEKKENRNKVIEFVRRNGVAPFIETFVPGLFYQKDNPFVPTVHAITSQTLPETLIAYAAAMRDRPPREELLESFPKPILVIAGEQDTIVGYEAARDQSKRIRFPFFRGLTDVGHMGMFENEQATMKIVKDFMNFVLDFKV